MPQVVKTVYYWLLPLNTRSPLSTAFLTVCGLIYLLFEAEWYFTSIFYWHKKQCKGLLNRANVVYAGVCVSIYIHRHV